MSIRFSWIKHVSTANVGDNADSDNKFILSKHCKVSLEYLHTVHAAIVF